MTSGTAKILKILAIPAALITYVIVAGTTGFCPTCEGVVNTVATSAGIIPVAHKPEPSPATSPETKADEPEFKQRNRPGSVDINKAYDTSNPQIPLDEVHTLLPKDAIPALTDPTFEPVADSDWLPDEARVIVLEGDSSIFAIPLTILDSHEIVNMTLDGKPIAATYCPLCDSATVISRAIIAASKPTAPHRPAPSHTTAKSMSSSSASPERSTTPTSSCTTGPTTGSGANSV